MTKTELRKIIGENVRKHRIARKMPIDEFAKKLDYSASFVGLIEHGRRGVTAHNVFRISQIFEIDVESLFAESDGIKTVVKNESSNSAILRNRLRSMIKYCDESELDFMITLIKALRQLERANCTDTEEDEE